MTFADLPEALTWLDSHIDFESAMPTRRALPSLDRMRALAALLPLRRAAEELGVSETALKAACRRLGLPAWPRYSPAADVLMNFTAAGKPVAMPDPFKARLDVVADSMSAVPVTPKR